MMKGMSGTLFVLLSVIPVHFVRADVALRQSGIVLNVKNLLPTGAIESFKLNMTRASCGYKGIQPVALMVKNESDVPVRISAQSLRATRIAKEQLIIQDSYVDQVGISLLIGSFLGLPLLIIESKAIADNNVVAFNGNLVFQRYFNGRYPSFPLVAIGWSVITAAAFILAWGHHSFNNHNARQLAKLMLAGEIVIQPGQTVRKIAFLDAQYYNGLFTFQVLSDDKKRYVASFDVELFD
jgi:hypothetical protein